MQKVLNLLADHLRRPLSAGLSSHAILGVAVYQSPAFKTFRLGLVAVSVLVKPVES